MVEASQTQAGKPPHAPHFQPCREGREARGYAGMPMSVSSDGDGKPQCNATFCQQPVARRLNDDRKPADKLTTRQKATMVMYKIFVPGSCVVQAKSSRDASPRAGIKKKEKTTTTISPKVPKENMTRTTRQAQGIIGKRLEKVSHIITQHKRIRPSGETYRLHLLLPECFRHGVPGDAAYDPCRSFRACPWLVHLRAPLLRGPACPAGH